MGEDQDEESESIRVADGIFLSTSPILLRRLIEIAPPRTRVLTGYAGWGPGQLDAELSSSAWLITDIDPRLVFETAPEDMWESAIRSLGADPGKLQMGQGVH
jgi:putative transcriptional regulator